MTQKEAESLCAAMNAAFLKSDRGGKTAYNSYLAAQAMRKKITDAGYKLSHNKKGIFTVLHKNEEAQ